MCIETTKKCHNCLVKFLRMKSRCASTFFRTFTGSGAKVRPIQASVNGRTASTVEERPAPAVSSAGTGACLRPMKRIKTGADEGSVAVVDKNVIAGDGVTRRIQQDCGRAGNYPFSP